MPDFALQRQQMAAQQIEARGIQDGAVLTAMRTVPRELFVPEAYRDQAYADGPLPIGHGQTISQPFIVACMAQALQLKGRERVLEVGGGCGYAAAVLAQIAAEIFVIERVAELVDLARANLALAGVRNVHLRFGDGSLGWVDAAPFDAILVSAAAPAVPEHLKRQLGIGGRLVVPIGTRDQQQLVRLTRTSEESFLTEEIGAVMFVRLIGEGGWKR